MNPQQIVGLAVRLFSIWLGVVSFQMYGIGMAISQELQDFGFLKYGLPVPVMIVAVLLWLFPMTIALRLLPNATKQETSFSFPAREMAAAGAAILGIWALIGSFPPLASTLILVVLPKNVGVFETTVGASALLFSSKFFSSAGQFAIGVYLVRKPWKVAEKIFPKTDG